MARSIFDIGNTRFLEDVMFRGEDNLRNAVFKEEFITLPNVVLGDVQVVILDNVIKTIPEQNKNMVLTNELELQTQ